MHPCFGLPAGPSRLLESGILHRSAHLAIPRMEALQERMPFPGAQRPCSAIGCLTGPNLHLESDRASCAAIPRAKAIPWSGSCLQAAFHRSQIGSRRGVRPQLATGPLGPGRDRGSGLAGGGPLDAADQQHLEARAGLIVAMSCPGTFSTMCPPSPETASACWISANSTHRLAPFG